MQNRTSRRVHRGKTRRESRPRPQPRAKRARTRTLCNCRLGGRRHLCRHVYFLSADAAPDPDKPKMDPEMAAIMEAGPLEDIVLGDPDADTIIVEYASMTCPHCAHFYKEVFPELKKKYIDTGKARFIFREFPLDGLAVAASMLARCVGQRSLLSDVGRAVRNAGDLGGAGRRRQGEALAHRQAGGLFRGKLRKVHGGQGAVRQDRGRPQERLMRTMASTPRRASS